MKSNLRVLNPKTLPHGAGLEFSAQILRFVKSTRERQAIASGQIDAVIDRATGKFFLLPEAQRALHQDQATVRSLLALSADWCWEQDENYCFVSYSSTTSGNSVPCDETIIGKLLWDLPFHNMREADWDTHRRQLESRVAFRDLELAWVDGAGKARYLSVSGEPVFDAQDQLTGYRGTMRDISERKQLEASAQGLPVGVAERKRKERPLGRGHKVAQTDPIANSLLAALPRKDYQGLVAGLEVVTLTYGQVLYEPGERIRHVFFPNDCLVSLLTTVEGDKALEVGLIGREGMVGISLALGMEVSSVRALVQGTGTAMRMNAGRFRREFGKRLPLQGELYRVIHVKLAQARQSAACNRFHVVEARLARWLLMTGDRLRSDQFLLTHEFLADMLGVRRPGVTGAAHALQQSKLISYRHGRIRILDRKGLEGAACQCYEVFRT
jgi:PAS domain S-box-containing protein